MKLSSGKTLLVAVALAFLTCVSVSCEKDDDNGCVRAAQEVAAAQQNYLAQQSIQNCQIYKATIVTYLNSTCGQQLSSSDRLQFQNALNNLPC
jgi:AICAR transformylase/IMP cyclohydrolase PurH